HVPVQIGRTESVTTHPRGHVDLIECRRLSAEVDRNGELGRRAQVADPPLEFTKFVAILFGQAYDRLDPFLPSTMEEQALLRRETEVTLLELTVLDQPELLEQLAHER